MYQLLENVYISGFARSTARFAQIFDGSPLDTSDRLNALYMAAANISISDKLNQPSMGINGKRSQLYVLVPLRDLGPGQNTRIICAN